MSSNICNKCDNKDKLCQTEKEKKSGINKKKQKKVKNEIEVVEEKNFFKKVLIKKNITFFALGLIDIILIIYVARQNIVNYVKFGDQSIFISKTRYLLLGRNYITIVVTAFFYGYICLINKFFLKQKNTKKFLILLFLILVIVNLGLFCIFTKRVY